MIPNTPRVMILIGIVRIVRIGLINKLMKPRTSPAINATVHPVTVIPGITYAAKNTAADNSNHLKIIFIINICW